MSMKEKIIRNIRREILKHTSPLAIHVEAIHTDRVWEKVQKLAVNDKEKIWFVLTPVNYDFVKSIIGIKLKKRGYSRLLEQRYRILLESNQNLQLHVHLVKDIDIIHKKEQERVIKEALSWCYKVGFYPTKFVPGWFIYNKDTEEVLKKLNLQLVSYYDYYFIHDFDLIKFHKVLK